MKRKIFLLTALILAFVCLRETYFSSDDRDLQSANFVYNSAIEEDVFFNGIEKFIKAGRLREIEVYVGKVKDPALRALSFAKMAYMLPERSEKDRLANKAFSIMRDLKTTRYEDKLLQIIFEFARQDDPKWFMEFLNLANYSNDLVLAVYEGGKYEKISALYAEKIKNENFKKLRPRIHIAMLKKFYCRNLEKQDREFLEKQIYYEAIQFNMNWDLKEHGLDFRIPLLAYFSRAGGREDFYASYKDAAFSEIQLKNMQPAYEAYVEYGAKVFSLSGDADAAIALIKTLKNPKDKSRVLKHCVRFLMSAKGGREALENSGLLGNSL